jgi:uncharacterized damage-inducible protein DinB
VKKMMWVYGLLLIAFCTFATAQMARSATPTPGQVLEEWIINVEKEVVPAADAMPEDKYDFAPRNGEFAGVRTFAEEIKHLAAANYQLGSRVLGEQPPAGTAHERAPESVKTKAEIMAYLRGSFACLHRAAARMDEKSALEPLPDGPDSRLQTRLGLLVDALAHSSNHYGQMVEYLRMNGIVPPASR